MPLMNFTWPLISAAQSRHLPCREGIAPPRAVGRVYWITAIAAIGWLALLRTQFMLSLTSGESMQPTIQNPDLLVVFRTAYHTQPPSRGDVVVVREAGELIVKRIVGLPGDEVEVRRGVIYLNDELLLEPYCGAGVKDSELNITRGKMSGERFAILGDNRTVPRQLFTCALVSKDQIVGKVVFVLRGQHAAANARSWDRFKRWE
jgi:signal peptidase I